jgi:hypothetical protein
MPSREMHHIDEAYMSGLTWLAAGLATGVALALMALGQEVASRRFAVRAAAARIAPAFVTVSAALH